MSPSAAAAAAAASVAAKNPVGISLGGKIFFGGLTAGTFGLGCWQIQRYYEKVDMMKERNTELAMDPTTDWQSPQAPYRRKLLEGRLLHHKEVLIGPRGAPIDPKNNTGGMGPGAQGFMVLTPLQLIDGQLVWINRGWVPKAMVPGANRGAGSRPSHKPPSSDEARLNQWERPSGTVQVTAIRSKPERKCLL
jgi:cytochrome oxidase assembly protein ShyY1